MITIRKSAERGHAHHGWLDTYHTFSFADYHDAAQMGWGPLRVINEDVVEPDCGFPTHGHRDMEIFTFILEGQLEHQDSMGNGNVIYPGDVQRMSAGRGVMHSEFNPSKTERVHLLQIWIEPAAANLTPSYEQKHFLPEERRGRLRLLASNDGRDGSVVIHQDAAIYASLLATDQRVSHSLAPGRRAYLQVAVGAVTLNGQSLSVGDGAKIQDEATLAIAAQGEAELLLFDLP